MKFIFAVLLLSISLAAGAENRFVSNDGTWKMKDASGKEMTGTCFTSLKSALGNNHVIYVKNDYDCSGDTPTLDGNANARYYIGGGYSDCTIRSESGDWRTGPTLTGGWDAGGDHGRGANAFRVFGKSGINSSGIKIIGFKLVDGATPNAGVLSGNTVSGCGGLVGGRGAGNRITLRNCLLSGGSAGEGGAAFMCCLYDCVVTNNYATLGGGVSNSSKVSGSTVMYNKAVQSGGGVHSSTLTNCVVACNECTTDGMYGGALNSCTAYNCLVTNNVCRGVSGGGCLSCTTYNCLIADNTLGTTDSTVGRGGGGVLYGTHYNALIARNTCGCYGSAARSAVLYNCTLVGNVSTHAGGHTHSTYECQMYNGILWGNRTKGGSLVPSYFSIVSNSCLEVSSAPKSCINENPKFVDAAAGDYRPRNRKCRDTAQLYPWMTNTTKVSSKDLVGNKRVVGKGPDMGCYERPLSGAAVLVR